MTSHAGGSSKNSARDDSQVSALALFIWAVKHAFASATVALHPAKPLGSQLSIGSSGALMHASLAVAQSSPSRVANSPVMSQRSSVDSVNSSPSEF